MGRAKTDLSTIADFWSDASPAKVRCNLSSRAKFPQPIRPILPPWIFVNNLSPAKSIGAQGKFRVWHRTAAKHLRFGISSAKNFLHKVSPEARMRPA
jgi:hypothetical protein